MNCFLLPSSIREVPILIKSLYVLSICIYLFIVLTKFVHQTFSLFTEYLVTNVPLDN
jgi:hypothetical protein